MGLSSRTIWLSFVAILQNLIHGFLYSFPMWLIAMKHLIGLDQTEDDVIGVVLYSSVNFIGIPLSVYLIPRLSSMVAVLVSVSSSLGYGLCYMVSDSIFHDEKLAYIMFLLGIALIMTNLGIWYSYCSQTLNAAHHFGEGHELTVSAMLNIPFALGGFLMGLYIYFGGPSVQTVLLVCTVFQAAATPIISLVTRYTADPVPTYTVPTKSSHSEDDPLLKTSIQGRDDLGDDEKDATPTPPTLTWTEFFTTTFYDWRYYHVVLVTIFKVGIGSTYTTNLGTAIQATMSSESTEDDINNNVSLIVLILTGGQLLGRSLMLLFSMFPIRGNPNLNTIWALVLISVGYIIILALRIWGPFSTTLLFIYSGIFGLNLYESTILLFDDILRCLLWSHVGNVWWFDSVCARNQQYRMGVTHYYALRWCGNYHL
eukprot:m.84631 g.84631  ORF g.84631 m.84631 type:complete len:426 (+) comp12974_c0_seq4:150-1427(+)